MIEGRLEAVVQLEARALVLGVQAYAGRRLGLLPLSSTHDIFVF